MPILFYYISSSIKNVTLFSQKCGEKQYGSAFKVGPHLSFLKPFQYYETSCLGTQNCPFIFLCIPNKVKESSQHFLYTTIMDQKCTNDIRF